MTENMVRRQGRKGRQGSFEELFSINSELSVEAELTDSTFVCFSVAFPGARRNVRLCSMYEDKTTSVGSEEIFQRASEETRYLQSLSGKRFHLLPIS